MNGRLPAWATEGAGFASREVPGVSASGAPRSRGGRRPRPCAAELADGVLAGDRGALSRAITLVESNASQHRPAAREVLLRTAGHRDHVRRIGISGVPGAGKSTFIEAFGNYLCDHGRRLAVLAVDPSSSLSGGSILGDKTRMETLARRTEAFIRPSPAAGALGGVARKTRESIALCEAAGYDTILVETVGVGQSEYVVRSMVDCFLLLMLAGAGDELQGIKKGIVEIADILAVNKADGDNQRRAQATRAELERVTGVLSHATKDWRPPVLAISSIERTGIAGLWDAILAFFAHIEASGLRAQRRREQALAWWHSLVEGELRRRFLAIPAVAAHAASLEADILAGAKAPSVAAEELLADLVAHHAP